MYVHSYVCKYRHVLLLLLLLLFTYKGLRNTGGRIKGADGVGLNYFINSGKIVWKISINITVTSISSPTHTPLSSSVANPDNPFGGRGG